MGIYKQSGQQPLVREVEAKRNTAVQTGMASVESMVDASKASLAASAFIEDADDELERDEATAKFLAAAVARIRQESPEVQAELLTFITGVKQALETPAE